MTARDDAPRCDMSGKTQMIDRELWVEGGKTPCNVCGQHVKFRVRVSDLPPWARILPHRVDGRPCR